jgi:hypothetical protein
MTPAPLPIIEVITSCRFGDSAQRSFVCLIKRDDLLRAYERVHGFARSCKSRTSTPRHEAYLARLRQIRSFDEQEFKTMDWISGGKELNKLKAEGELVMMKMYWKNCQFWIQRYCLLNSVLRS